MTHHHPEKKLVLFDIDGTLLRAGRAHWKVFKKAFKEIVDIDIKDEHWGSYQGFTDIGIIYDLMEKYGITKDKATTQKIMDVMIREFEKADLSDAILIDGVKEILMAMGKHDEIIIGLVTGNLENIAYTKLRHFNIKEYFILGGFGHISDVRSELILHVIEDAEEKFGKITKDNIFIIGDTPRDINAAKDAGVKVIAVATGRISLEELENCNPDYAFANLKDVDKVLEVIHHG